MDPSADRAFRNLERALTRRRLDQIDGRLRVELALLGLLIAGFVFWQVRVPLDGLHRRGGDGPVLLFLASVCVGLAVIGGALVAARHARHLRNDPSGPSWLALPIPTSRLARHLAWNSRLHALWVVVPVLGVLAAAVGLVAWWWLPLFAALLVWLLLECGRLGAAIGFRLARRGVSPRPGIDPLVRVLSETGGDARGQRLRPAAWRGDAPWRALASKDLRVTLRRPVLLRSLAAALLLGAFSAMAWTIPGALGMRHLVAFTLGLLTAAAFAEWLVGLSGTDPFAALRTLPVGVATLWITRVTWAAAGTALLLIAHVIAARGLSAHALQVFLVWLGAASLGIGVLGVNYGVTLFPRVDIAQRLLGLSLALAVAASIMLPLSGWIVLLSAILHSARRLPRWSRLEEAA